jgi:hypothetical protein
MSFAAHCGASLVEIEEFMRSTLVVCLFISALLSSAQTSSRSAPVGRWKTVDDATNKAKSVVVIWEENGKLNGKIEKLIEPDPQYPDPRCVRCEGDMKDKCFIAMEDGGKKLRVRGFIGFSVLGRTQYWLRDE